MMALVRYSPALRVVTGFLAATILLTLFYATSTSNSNTNNMAPRSSDPISGLKVSLEQAGSAAAPLTIVATVTNTNDKPVTVLEYDSPLDSLALQLGLLKITPEGATEPMELPIIQFRRVWPPSKDSLITIPAGGSAKNEIPLKEPLIKPQDLSGKPSVKLVGQWRAVWEGGKAGISEASLDDPIGRGDVFTGDFASDSLELNLT